MEKRTLGIELIFFEDSNSYFFKRSNNKCAADQLKCMAFNPSPVKG
ncbi:hypothetical protein AQPE_4358 [Aquipluma nitroreducens]|uniref:Uncharacterized protein n=1 Tax=Aquipluma nitroreducens TaxID=2010828 RepID=A0A5K7SFG3_9BACT|nr:hypothetical protein AQPE_4358 [Aquipluma nitroreducens]